MLPIWLKKKSFIRRFNNTSEIRFTLYSLFLWISRWLLYSKSSTQNIEGKTYTFHNVKWIQPFMLASDLILRTPVLLQIAEAFRLSQAWKHKDQTFFLDIHSAGFYAFIQILPALHMLFLELGFLIRFIEKLVNSDFASQEVLGINLIKETH